MSWDHGYYSQAAYTAGFYREMAPNWIDFAALVGGHEPPRPREGEPFAYLDLGSGMGFGLCLLAALYPEGRFTGVDFQPEHIAHSRWLARRLGITNATFLEADFLSLQRDPSPLGVAAGTPGDFHYVAAHGIATWVSEPVQDALLAVAAAALTPGGLFYCSYNTFPGWLPNTAIRELVRLERQRSDPALPGTPLNRSMASLQALLGPAEEASPLARSQPKLQPELRAMKDQDQRYLSQEYANEGWQPLYVAQFHQRCLRHKLTPLATATLPELFEVLLSASLQAAVRGEANPLIRQTLIDLATNKSFRRDLLVKGAVMLSPKQQQERLGELRFRLQEAPPIEAYSFKTCFGSTSGPTELLHRFELALTDQPLPLSELSSRCERPISELIVVAALLLHANRIGLDRSAAGDTARQQCLDVNRAIQDLILQDSPYAMLAAPAIGTGVGFTLLETMLHEAFRQGLEGDLLALCVQTGLAAEGATINTDDGEAITDPTAQLQRLSEIAELLRTRRLPFLRALGAFPPGP